MKDAEEPRARGPKSNSPEVRDPRHDVERQSCPPDVPLLDWIEATMDPTEREHMLAIPDHDAESPGEVEQHAKVQQILSSLSADPAPAELWSEVRHRVRTSRVSLAPPLVQRILRYRKALAASAAAVLLAVTFLFTDPFGSNPTAPSRWLIIDEEAFEAELDPQDRLLRDMLVGEWPVSGSPAEMYAAMSVSGPRPGQEETK